MQKVLFLIITIFFFAFAFFSPVEAKILPRFASGKKTITKSFSSGITVYPRLRSDRKAIIVNFGNLNKAKSIVYTLSYETNGKEEGVNGTLDPSSSNSATRELLFGTCSNGVCRYHTGISKMRLEITTILQSGKTVIKRFRASV